MNLKTIEEIVDNQKVSFVCSTDDVGFHDVKAMLNC